MKWWHSADKKQKKRLPIRHFNPWNDKDESFMDSPEPANYFQIFHFIFYFFFVG